MVGVFYETLQYKISGNNIAHFVGLSIVKQFLLILLLCGVRGTLRLEVSESASDNAGFFDCV
jgi:hypothetical protein